MKKLLILSAGFLCVAGFVSIAWAHGPNGGGFGHRGYSSSKPYFNKPFQTRSGRHLGRHHKHLHRGSLNPSKQRHLRRAQRSRRLPGIVNGVIQSKPGPLQNRSFSSPIAKAYDSRDWRQPDQESAGEANPGPFSIVPLLPSQKPGALVSLWPGRKLPADGFDPTSSLVLRATATGVTC